MRGILMKSFVKVRPIILSPILERLRGQQMPLGAVQTPDQSSTEPHLILSIGANTTDIGLLEIRPLTVTTTRSESWYQRP